MFLSSRVVSTSVSFLSGISKEKYINEVKHKSVKQARISLVFKYVTRKVIGHVNVCIRFGFISTIFRFDFGSVLMLWDLFFHYTCYNN